MAIAFTDLPESTKAEFAEDPAMKQKNALVLLSETEKIVGQLSQSDLMTERISLCIGWRRIKICVHFD